MARRIGIYGIPFKAAEELIATERKGKFDIYAALNDLRLEVHDSLAPLGSRFKITVKAGSKSIPATTTPHSMAQVCNLLKVPPQFVERLPAAVALRLLRTLQDTSELADGRSFLMRFRKKEDQTTLRAVLPSSYVRFDDLEIVRMARAAMSGTLEVGLIQVDEDSMSLRLIQDASRPVNLGTEQRKDPGRVGISILSSETGAHPLELRHLLLRLVCENGLTVPIEDQKALRQRLTQVDRSVVTRAVDSALSQMVPRGLALADQLAETRAQMVPEPEAEVRGIFQRHRLGSPNGRIGRWVTEEVKRNLTLFGAQRFDIVQAFTAVARGLESRDRLRFEDAMGAYLGEVSTN